MGVEALEHAHDRERLLARAARMAVLFLGVV
jgi:hypothetical protein